MPRYKLTIEYDGQPFAGWQMQADLRTVQGDLTEAVRRFSGEQVLVQGAGRTDSGVHALGQVAHVDLNDQWPAGKVRDALNFHLKPNAIAVVACEAVADGFNARFSATARHYRYRIQSRRAPAAIEASRVWWVPVVLDLEAMQSAAQVLVGRHDFTTFRAAACQAKSPVKSLDRLDVFETGGEIWIEASARSFLHSQVRSMAGGIKMAGAGKWSIADLRAALAARDRTRCPPVAPACGLYLTRVEYGEGRDISRAGFAGS